MKTTTKSSARYAQERWVICSKTLRPRICSKLCASGCQRRFAEVARRVVTLFTEFQPVSTSGDLPPQERQLLKLQVEGTSIVYVSVVTRQQQGEDR